MRLLGEAVLEEFIKRHADARGWLDAWRTEVKTARWRFSHDLKSRYPSSSIVGDGRVVFNVRGNRYRLEVRVDYQSGIVLMLRAGTHAEYDRWT